MKAVLTLVADLFIREQKFCLNFKLHEFPRNGIKRRYTAKKKKFSSKKKTKQTKHNLNCQMKLFFF